MTALLKIPLLTYRSCRPAYTTLSLILTVTEHTGLVPV